MNVNAMSHLTDWLNERKKLLTASDVGAVLGISPFKSNGDVWLDKTSDTIDEKTGWQLEFGHKIEAPVAEKWALDNGAEIRDPGDFEIAIHPDVPWIGSTLDREYRFSSDEPWRPLEIKNVGNRRISQAAWTEDPPLYNRMQVHTQCSCKVADSGKLIGLFGYDIAEVDIAFDSELWDLAFAELDKFWNYNVKKKIPPERIIGGDGLETVKRLYPKDDGSTVHMEGFLSLVDKWEATKAAAVNLKNEADNIKLELLQKMGSATFGNLGDGTFLTLKQQSKNETTIKASTFRVLRRQQF